jgi:3-hydroxyacyl-CoA dehydrogenase
VNNLHTPIKRVAVIGSGVMGAGIAAHCANAGCEVLLLDIVLEGATDRNIVAKEAIEKISTRDKIDNISDAVLKAVLNEASQT